MGTCVSIKTSVAMEQLVLRDFSLQVVLLDECSQMTEPASLLPLARFGCEKLVLVGDPNQLASLFSVGCASG